MHSPLENLLTHLIHDSHQTELLIQLAVVVTSVAISFLATRGLVAWLLSQYAALRQEKRAIKAVVFPMMTLWLVAIAREMLRNAHELHLLNIVVPLLIALLIIRIAMILLHHLTGSREALRVWGRAIVWVVWLGFALHITGLLPMTANLLDRVAFVSGNHRFSLLLLLEAITVITVAVVVALWLSQVIEARLMRTQGMDPSLRLALIKFLRSALLIIGVIIALPAVGIDITILSVFGGALGVGLGLGLQKIASNYVSGFIILLDRSIRPGDMITVDGQYGEVRQINTRYTLLRALNGTEIILPNETLITSTVINHSFTQREVRFEIPVQISYDSDIEQARALMHNIAIQHPRVLNQDTYTVETNLTGFGDNGINLVLRGWIADPEAGQANLISDIYLSLLHAFNTEGIEIPYPRRDVRYMNAERTGKETG